MTSRSAFALRHGGVAALIAAAALVVLGACGAPAREDAAETPAPRPDASAALDEAALAAVEPVNYDEPASWLCRPGAADACTADASATVIAPDGTMTLEPFTPAESPPIDCFYVYPTVSLDETPNADLIAGEEEDEVVRQQLVRFGSACRLYAPLYRQVTLPALRQMLRGETPETDREMAYADIRAAWTHYLANDNGGRGVVLIGHSQGAGLLSRLIAAEIEGEPAQDLLVSALLIGSNLAVPEQGGGAFDGVGLCRSADETGCAIAYSSFRADAPPAEGALFGAVVEAGMQVACVNPAELDGSGDVLRAYLPTRRVAGSMAAPGPWTAVGDTPETPFATVPGLLSARCETRDGRTYLAVTVNADPADARTDVITGDVIVDGQVQPGWGLHLVDVNLAIGNLVAVVQRQGNAWVAMNPPAPGAAPDDAPADNAEDAADDG